MRGAEEWGPRRYRARVNAPMPQRDTVTERCRAVLHAGKRGLGRGAVRSVMMSAGMAAVMGAGSGCAGPPVSPWAELQYDTTHGFQDALLDRLAGTWVVAGAAGKRNRRFLRWSRRAGA